MICKFVHCLDRWGCVRWLIGLVELACILPAGEGELTTKQSLLLVDVGEVEENDVGSLPPSGGSSEEERVVPAMEERDGKEESSGSQLEKSFLVRLFAGYRLLKCRDVLVASLHQLRKRCPHRRQVGLQLFDSLCHDTPLPCALPSMSFAPAPLDLRLLRSPLTNSLTSPAIICPTAGDLHGGGSDGLVSESPLHIVEDQVDLHQLLPQRRLHVLLQAAVGLPCVGARRLS
eukprot:299509-Hanusia_phi.AAC.3